MQTNLIMFTRHQILLKWWMKKNEMGKKRSADVSNGKYEF
jgi:hypothetical protein